MTCSEADCVDLVVARGWCRRHYERFRPRSECLLCTEPAVSRGWCKEHYRRWQRNGDPLAGRLSNATVEERFWQKVPNRTEGECWLWEGARNGSGAHRYGSFWAGESYPNGSPRFIGSHRFVWRIVVGEIPDDQEVCHHCDVPHCVNPSHLFLGTHAENMGDCKRKGRAPRRYGTSNNKSKMTPSQVVEARAAFTGAHGETPMLARRYGISAPAMASILKGEHWKVLV